jgi:mRNA interferase MazF
MIRPYQWALVYVDLSPTIGSEQGGRRPVLIVSDEPFNQAMPMLTVLPLSSTRRRLYPAEVSLKKDVAGQPQDSIVMAHQVRAISKQRVTNFVGYLADVSLRHEVQQALRDHFDLASPPPNQVLTP